MKRLGPSTVSLPVSSGYHVLITLAANDTFTVTRAFIRSGKVTDKGTMTDVYVDEVSECAYYAGMYRSGEFGS